MIFVSSVARSTFDCSSALPIIEPRPPAPAVPTKAAPDASDAAYRPPPSETMPLTLLKPARAICATFAVVPLLNTAEIVPSDRIERLLNVPAAEPFCVFEVTALALAKPLIVGLPLAESSTCHERFELNVAPSANVGAVTPPGGIPRFETLGFAGAVPI